MATLQSPEEQPSFAQSVASYSAYFGKDDDQTGVLEQERQKRQQRAAELTDSFYDFATSAWENGWGQRFHYSPHAPGETLLQAAILYEHRLALLMGLKPGMKVLDVGCGIGAPAREIAKLVGCEIVGISINQHQVDRARKLTAKSGLEHQCIFMRGDFLNLPFPPASFDAAYAIEATCHAPSLAAAYSGVARVLKPGGVFGVSEWVLTPTYDTSNTQHIGIRNRIERGNAITNLQTSEHARAAMVSAGFDLYHDEDFAQHWARLGHDLRRPSVPGSSIHPATSVSRHNADSPSNLEVAAPSHPPVHRPWFSPLVGRPSLAAPGSLTDYRKIVLMTKPARRICTGLVWVLEHLHLYPKGTLAAMKTLAYCVDSVVEGGQEEIFTPCWWFIGRKRNNVDDRADQHPDEEGALRSETESPIQKARVATDTTLTAPARTEPVVVSATRNPETAADTSQVAAAQVWAAHAHEETPRS